MAANDRGHNLTGLSREQALIRKHFAPLSAKLAGAEGFEDDAFVLAPESGYDHVITKDMLVEGSHYLPADPADLVARKALRTNLSDLAAKGAEPFAYFVGLCLGSFDPEWIALFAAGLEHDQGLYPCALAGGDTVRSGGLSAISITAVGRVACGRAVRRTGARPGDHIYVSGTIGDSMLGLSLHKGEKPDWAEALDDDERRFLTSRYLVPEPRVSLAPALVEHARAAMDVSDGLVGDLQLLCRASGVGAVLELGHAPLSAAGKRAVATGGEDLLVAMVTGGDDYEILCTVGEDHVERFEKACAGAGCPVYRIGRIGDAGAGVEVYGPDGDRREPEHASYSHIPGQG